MHSTEAAAYNTLLSSWGYNLRGHTSFLLCSLDIIPTAPPPFASITVTDDTVTKVASRLSGSCGLGGTDGPALKDWLLRHREPSGELREAFIKLINWQANTNIPWAAIRALNSNRGLALEKDSGGVRPIGIGNIERRFMAKCVIAVAGPTATEAAGTTQLAVGLTAGIEGAIHAARRLWEAQANEPDFGFLMIDAKNAFNEQDRNMTVSYTHLTLPTICSV